MSDNNPLKVLYSLGYIQVEESLPSNIILLKNPKTNRKIYLQACSPQEILSYGISFILLTKEMLWKNGIQVEETYSLPIFQKIYNEEGETGDYEEVTETQEQQGIYVEESEGEPASKPETLWNPTKESLEDFKERMKTKVPAGSYVQVKIEPEEIEQLRAERDDYRSKLELVAEKAFAKKKQELGCDDENITSPSQLQAWQSGKEGRKETPSGSASLQGQTTGQYIDDKEGGFDSYEDMMSHLQVVARNKTSPSGSTADKILNEFMRKSLDASRKTGKTVEYVQKTSLKDEINAKFRKEQQLRREQNQGEVE
jgi:hypothetical protein